MWLKKENGQRKEGKYSGGIQSGRKRTDKEMDESF